MIRYIKWWKTSPGYFMLISLYNFVWFPYEYYIGRFLPLSIGPKIIQIIATILKTAYYQNKILHIWQCQTTWPVNVVVDIRFSWFAALSRESGIEKRGSFLPGHFDVAAFWGRYGWPYLLWPDKIVWMNFYNVINDNIAFLKSF